MSDMLRHLLKPLARKISPESMGIFRGILITTAFFLSLLDGFTSYMTMFVANGTEPREMFVAAYLPLLLWGVVLLYLLLPRIAIALYLAVVASSIALMAHQEGLGIWLRVASWHSPGFFFAVALLFVDYFVKNFTRMAMSSDAAP